MRDRQKIIRGIAAGLALLGAVPASAADMGSRPTYVAPSPMPTGYIVTIGGDVRWINAWEGANHFRISGSPYLDIRPAGTAPRFFAPRDGLGIALYDTGAVRAGVVGKLHWPRKEKSYPSELQGLGNVDYAVEVGGFVEYYPVQWFRLRAELRQGIGGHTGQTGDIFGDFIWRFAPQWTLSGGPRVSFATGAAENPYFSVNFNQTLLSGLPVYQAKGGLHSAGAGAQLRWDISPQWATYTFVEYERLADQVAMSPIVGVRGNANQGQFGVGATYSFNWSGFNW